MPEGVRRIPLDRPPRRHRAGKNRHPARDHHQGLAEDQFQQVPTGRPNAIRMPIFRVRCSIAESVVAERPHAIGIGTPAAALPAGPALAVLDARLDVRIRRIDEPAQRGGVCARSRFQLHMTHELARAL